MTYPRAKIITTLIAATITLQPAAALAADLGTVITYQGDLKNNGVAVTDPACAFLVSLWDSEVVCIGGDNDGEGCFNNAECPGGTCCCSGTQVGGYQTEVAGVTDGLFIIRPDFGPGAIDGTARWLQIEIKCTGDAGFTPLKPRVKLNPTPHALALPGLYTQQNATSPNLIGGYHGNQIVPDFALSLEGITIGGGGSASSPHRVDGPYSTIGGGRGNQTGYYADLQPGEINTVGGGGRNQARGLASTVGGGGLNIAGGFHATIGGGVNNLAGGSPYEITPIYAYGAVVGGGAGNQARASYATIAGGLENVAPSEFSTIGGGGAIVEVTCALDYPNANACGTCSGGSNSGGRCQVNLDCPGGYCANGDQGSCNEPCTLTYRGNRALDLYNTVAGGGGNTAGSDDSDQTNASFATVAGGIVNIAGARGATVGGGRSNRAVAAYATIAGGGGDVVDNTEGNLVTDNWGTIGGGKQNIAGNGYGIASDAEGATVGGGRQNTAEAGHSTVAGGEQNWVRSDNGSIGGGSTNLVGTADNTIRYGTVSGGFNNESLGYAAAIGGGTYNEAMAAYSTIGGGGPHDPLNPQTTNNKVTDDYGTIGGGGGNRAGDAAGTTADSVYATVSGGRDNSAAAYYSSVAGGRSNAAQGWYSSISGGANNAASAYGAVIGGGTWNSAQTIFSTIAGGGPTNTGDPTATNNRTYDDYCTIGGGGGNRAGDGAGTTSDRSYATVGGGKDNNAGGNFSLIGGGDSNSASGLSATIPGGAFNQAHGDYSFAAGRRAIVTAVADGAFAWADSTNTDFQIIGANTFNVRASGGTKIYSNSAATVGIQLAAGGNSWSALSDRNVKENFTTIDPRTILQRVVDLPVTIWNLKSQASDIHHIGPMAQDFHAAFGVGESDTHISGSDADGVAFAAIQGLYDVVQEKDCQIAELMERDLAKDRRVGELENRLARLEAMLSQAAGKGENP